MHGSGRSFRNSENDYLRCFSAQVHAFGKHGQLRLRHAHVVVIGAGGVGTSICLALAGVGVGRLTAIDPQRLGIDNFNRYVFARDHDIGASKVSVLTRFLQSRSHLKFEGIVARGEAEAGTRTIKHADAVVSASNDVNSRLTMASLARQHGIPHVFVGVADGRFALGGTAGLWLPEREDLACQGCYLNPAARRPYGDALVSTVTSVVGGMAAHLIARLLTSNPREGILTTGNLIAVDLDGWQLETLLVRRRIGCSVCGKDSSRGR